MITGKYPSLRLRRNRKFSWTRRLIRENLKDPSSFKVLNSSYSQKETGIIKYSATNSFGARIQESFKCFNP